jgi:iron complex outermembrane receptor protein
MLGIEYDISDNSMIWLENSTGYKQGYRGEESQTLDAYQVGSKNRFLDQRLQVNAAAFYYDYQNYQVRSMQDYVNPDTGEVFMDMGSGAGDADLYGLDIDMNFLLTRNDYITLAASYLNSEIVGLVIEYFYSPPSTEFGGVPLNNSPEWTLAGGYKHHFFLSNGGTLTAGFDFRHRTEYFLEFGTLVTDVTDRVNIQPAHHMINASLNYASPGGKWEINAYVKNIQNYAEKIGGRGDTLKLSAPRTFGAVLSLRY